MVQHASAYQILDKLGCNSGEDFTIENHTTKLIQIRDEIRINLNKAHEKSEKTYNLRSRPISFSKGQIVYRKNHILSNVSNHINRKFMPKFIKCRIKKKIGNNLYETEDLGSGYIGKYHTSDFKT